MLHRVLALEVVARTSASVLADRTDQIREALLDERWGDAVVAWIQRMGIGIDVYTHASIYTADDLPPELIGAQLQFSPLFRAPRRLSGATTVASLRTEITEIVTGLALFGFRDLPRALAARPRFITNVDDDAFDRLEAAWQAGEHRGAFETAWSNGCVFARAADGLRGRPPWSVEWKGPHRPPAYEQIPADLRVDHVYLISCKYWVEHLVQRLAVAPVRPGVGRATHRTWRLVRRGGTRGAPGALLDVSSRAGRRGPPARPGSTTSRRPTALA